MCGIIGAFNSKADIKIGLKTIEYRGLDSTNFEFTNQGSLGHCLHAINNFVPQPIQKNDFSLVVNCEIYNWEQLNKKHNLNSKNDSDLLLNLFSNTNDLEETLKELDG